MADLSASYGFFLAVIILSVSSLCKTPCVIAFEDETGESMDFSSVNGLAYECCFLGAYLSGINSCSPILASSFEALIGLLKLWSTNLGKMTALEFKDCLNMASAF